jgi:hypothetical protein
MKAQGKGKFPNCLPAGRPSILDVQFPTYWYHLSPAIRRDENQVEC